MKRTRLLSLVVALACIMPACQKKQAMEQAPQTTPKVEKVQFVPSPDSSITRDQVSTWATCNPLLDSLAYLYQDSFKVDDPGVRVRCQNDFVKAQDALCVRLGLSGGYDEYLWIRKCMGNPKNKAILDSVGIAVY